MIQVAIMGHGVVGCGVAELLRNNAAHIAEKAGDTLETVKILDLREFPDCAYADLFTKRFEDITENADIRIVVETMGGLHPAYEYVKACLLAGKSVITSNKELVAQKGDELLSIAKEQNVNFLFEASVGGGIPILRPLHQCLAANEVQEIAGILNGTTNFMLTKMIDDGMQFADALALAQELGYAERDPSADIDGLDACRKICILASLVYGKHVYPDAVYTEGIRHISLTDVRYAAALGGEIKLIGHAAKDGDKVYCTVAPRVVMEDTMLSHVDDVFNAVMVKGDAVGDVVFYGRGAGKFPTASAVVADIIDAAQHSKERKPLSWDAAAENYVGDHRVRPVQMLVRVTCDDAAKAWTGIADAFGTVRQVTVEGAPADEFGFVTPVMREAALTEKLDSLENMTVVSRIRLA